MTVQDGALLIVAGWFAGLLVGAFWRIVKGRR